MQSIVHNIKLPLAQPVLFQLLREPVTSPPIPSQTLSQWPRLLPAAALLTPNIPEAEVLSGMEVKMPADMVLAAEKISKSYCCAVLVKGGHKLNDANDLLYRDGSYKWFSGKRIDNPNTHGTGCTLSSAIASNLAKGYSLDEAVESAKDYISGALAAMLNLGKGNGPLDHGYRILAEQH